MVSLRFSRGTVFVAVVATLLICSSFGAARGPGAENATTVTAELDASGSVTGTIVDGDGAPILDANVTLRNGSGVVRSVTTDLDGEYAVTVPSGDYTLVVTASGYEETQLPVTVTAGNETRVNLQIQREKSGATIAGSVSDDGGSPIANASVRVRNRSSVVTTATTDDDGVFAVDVPPGQLSVSVRKDGYRSTGETVQLDEGERRTVTFRMREAGSGDSDHEILISELESPSSVARGDPLEVTVHLRAEGGTGKVSQTIEYRLDLDGDGVTEPDEVVSSKVVTLQGDEIGSVRFTLPGSETRDLEPGEYREAAISMVSGKVTDAEAGELRIEDSSGDPEPDPDPDPDPDPGQDPEPDTVVGFGSQRVSAPVDGNRTIPVVVENVSGGVGAYEVTISVADPSVVEIVDLAGANTTAELTSVAEDGTNASASSFGDDTADSGDVRILNLTISGRQAGTTTLSITGTVTTETARDYGAVFESTTVNVTGDGTDDGVDVNGDGSASKNVDDDAAHEDVNGDGEVDVVDVQVLFAHRDDPAVQDNPDLFDFDGDGDVDIVDVQRLFITV